jgi:uncharacterized protein YwqG
MDSQLLEEFQLGQYYDQIAALEKPAIAFKLTQAAGAPAARSKLGGVPLIPDGFTWPRCQQRPLDFLLQIDLAETAPFDRDHLLPSSGLLTFFYDLKNLPWNYNPAHLDGFRVVYFPQQSFQPGVPPQDTIKSPERTLTFYPITTFPSGFTRTFERLEKACGWTKAESYKYYNFLEALDAQHYPKHQSIHRLLGYAMNIQNGMELDAQLVNNGVNLEERAGYKDPRIPELEPGADDWRLLLQLDTDDSAGLMWGDCGLQYYWMRADDLANRRFDKAWMTWQCG